MTLFKVYYLLYLFRSVHSAALSVSVTVTLNEQTQHVLQEQDLL